MTQSRRQPWQPGTATGVAGTVTNPSLGRMAFNGDTEVGDRPERDVYLSTTSRHLNLVTVEDVSYVIDENNF